MHPQEIGWGFGLDRFELGQGQAACACDHNNELSGSIKCREFLDSLRKYSFLKKNLTPRS
jgi:hypothetical protein